MKTLCIKSGLVTLMTLASTLTAFGAETNTEKKIEIILLASEAEGYSEEENSQFERDCAVVYSRFKKTASSAIESVGLAPTALEMNSKSSSRYKPVRVGSKHRRYRQQFEYVCKVNLEISDAHYWFITTRGESHFFESTCNGELANVAKLPWLIFSVKKAIGSECFTLNTQVIKLNEFNSAKESN
jgi:hypothetical protein